MWVNKQFETEDIIAWLKEFVDENTLSTLIAHDPLLVSHMPVELVNLDTKHPKVLFHVPTVDPLARALAGGSAVTVVVHGPQQYISPGLYKDEGLPTFNFGVAEVTDHCRTLSIDEVSEHLMRLMLERESMFSSRTGLEPWQMDAVARERFDRLLPRVAGFEVDLANTQLKLKMGQNRPEEDRHHTIERMRSARGIDTKVTSIMDELL